MFSYGAVYSKKAAEFCGLGDTMFCAENGVPEIRKLLLYPAELRGRKSPPLIATGGAGANLAHPAGGLHKSP